MYAGAGLPIEVLIGTWSCSAGDATIPARKELLIGAAR